MKVDTQSKFFIVVCFAILYACVEVIALYNLKKKNVPIALICYVFIAFILLNAYEYEGIGHMNIMTSVVSITLSFVISYMYLEERMNKYTVLSIIFAFLAIYFIYLSNE